MLNENEARLKDPVFTTDEVIKLLSVSKRTLQTWRDHGKIEFIAVGRKIFFRASAIEKMLNNHLVKTFSV